MAVSGYKMWMPGEHAGVRKRFSVAPLRRKRTIRRKLNQISNASRKRNRK